MTLYLHCSLYRERSKSPKRMKNAASTLGERIKALRLEKNLSMRALAELAHLKSVAFVADVEKGFRNPSPEVLTAFARALDIQPSELRDLDSRAPVQEIRNITEENPEWAHAFRRVVDAAKQGDVTPDNIIAFLNQRERLTHH
jgi:transcriptional regulator with XRE-family HTH domain